MVKLLGIGLVWGGCILGGLSAAAALRHRVGVLEDIGRGLELLERELALNRTSLPELLEQVSHRSTQQTKELFNNCRTELDKGNSFSHSWAAALDKSGLGEEEREVLACLAPVLGRYETQGQVQALSRLCRELEMLKARARERARALGRVYGVLGVTAGGFVCLMLV